MKNSRLTLAGFISAISFALISGSCGVKPGSSTDSDSVALGDSIQNETHLPDTILPSVEAISYKVEVVDSVTPGELEHFRDLYSEAPGIMTFRGGPRRDAPMTGKIAAAKPSKVEVVWKFQTGSDPKWYGGSGWTGQPVYVKWPAEMVEKFRANKVVNENFKGEEIIVGSLEGCVYFLDPASGNPTREKLDGHNPIKGSVSLDPTLNGYLYVGQGINNQRPFGAMTYDLMSNTLISAFDIDPKAQRAWGAYDSSALRHGNFVFRPGENGTLYKWLPTADGMKLHSTLRFTRNGEAPGMEASISVWKNYGYVADNKGNILCVNLDTMHPVWHFDNHDDTDSSPIVIEEGGYPYLYVGCEVDKQGSGEAYYTKLDALTGKKVWELSVPAVSVVQGKKHFDGGFYATPLPGRADCQGLLFAPVVKNTSGQNGSILAIDTKTGKVVWETPLKTYGWSSPVAFTSADGKKMYIFAADTQGRVYLLDGKSGEVLVNETIGSNFESSPVIIGDEVYVGSRGTYIFKMKIS